MARITQMMMVFTIMSLRVYFLRSSKYISVIPARISIFALNIKPPNMDNPNPTAFFTLRSSPILSIKYRDMAKNRKNGPSVSK